MCPVCYARGENADSDCESTAENEPCLEKDPVCALTVSTNKAQKWRHDLYTDQQTDNTWTNKSEW